MKKILYILLLVSALSTAQTNNYSKTTIYKDETNTPISNPTPVQALVSISYLDGFGRKIQEKAIKQSNSGLNIIQHIEYDVLGRQEKQFMPYVTSNVGLGYEATADVDVSNFYATPNITLTGNADFEATSFPYAQKVFDGHSGKVIESTTPGDVWSLLNGHTNKFEYLSNQANEVKKLTAVASWNSTLQKYDETFQDLGYYQANQLRKTIVKDENWSTTNPDHKVIKYIDKDGRLILLISFSGGQEHKTYYVYDQYDNIAYVIPPLAADTINTSHFDNLCYQYIYDYRNRLIEKKLPQKTWEFIVYDKQDRVMATGPNHAPFSDDPNTGWLINKYDVFNRVAYTGWYSAYYPNSTNRKVMQGLYNAQTNSSETRANTTINFVNTNYTNNTFPTTGFYLLTVNYYDNYNYPGAPVIPSDVELEPVNQNVKNLPTGSWVRVLTSIGEFNAEKAYVLYDKKYRAIRSYNTNYLGGYNQVDNKLDFVGKVLYSQTFHKKDNTVNVKQITNTFTYSPQDRLLRHIHQVDGGVEELISFKTYDELGNLISKNVGGTDITGAIGLQKIDYTYNVKGMLKSINDVNDISTDNDLFAFNIRYDNSDSATPLYNGNISETYWKTANDNNLRKYEYTYDGLNRLTLANYSRPDVVGPVIDSYREEIKYDKNGNITFLNRNGNSDYDITNGATEIDDLEYTYLPNSNRLMKVFDTSNLTAGFKDDSDGITDPIDDFDYDQYGNLVSDENKKIYLIKYNHLNLPIEIKFNNGNYIKYLYNAVGKKIKKDVVDLTVSPQKTEYLDGFQYVNNRLKFFPHAEGFVKYEKVVFGLGTPYATPYIQQSYVYNYTDHLGNVRVSYQLSQVTDEPVIIEENSYYPFGLKHSGYNSSGVINNYKYKFNGMESQDELGANLYDFGARNYDAAIGRWMNMDPHAENSISWSPYNFVNNNPIYYIDPDGNDPTPYEAALMAAHVYGGSKHGLKGGWKVSSLKVDLKDKPEGFKYGIYERTLSNGKKEYTVAFAGTDDIADLGDDLAQVAGLSPQYAAAAKLANQINSMLPNNTLVFTGHSLGGGLSNLSSLVTGRSSKTYNPAWLSAATLKTIKQKPLSKGNYIHNYVNRLDPLDALQRTDMAGRLDLIEHGKRFLVGDFWDNFVDDVYLGHMIDTMLEEMHDGELYDIYSNVFDADFDTDDGRDCFESRERDKDDWYEVSRSPRYF